MDPLEFRRIKHEGSSRGKLNHLYAAIEHRVIDSEAYADLSFSARSLLVLMVRQLSKDNNGQLHAVHSYMKKYGFGSEHTLARSIKDLISHGFIYRTRSGGYQQGAARYAVTWLSIGKQREGLFLDGFKACAWRDWVPQEIKTPPAKMQSSSCIKCSKERDATAENAVTPTADNADIELMPCIGVSNAYKSPSLPRNKVVRRPIRHALFAIRLNAHFDRGYIY